MDWLIVTVVETRTTVNQSQEYLSIMLVAQSITKKFQETIAMSSTETGVTATCHSGKTFIYIRPILHKIGIN